MRTDQRGRVILTLAAGLFLPALLLLYNAGEPFPVRVLPSELRMMLLVYLTGYTAVVLLLRRSAPDWLVSGLRWFTVAWVLRVAFLVVATGYAYWHNPAGAAQLQLDQRVIPGYISPTSIFEGYIGSDSYNFSYRARLLTMWLDGEAYGISLNEGYVGALREIEEMRATGEIVFQHWAIMSRIFAVTGYSTVAAVLPFSMLGAFWCIQVYAYLRHRVSPGVAVAVMAWMTFSPEFLCLSSMWHDDQPSAVVMCGVLLMLDRVQPRHKLSGVLGLVPVLLCIVPFRPQFIPLLCVFGLYVVAKRYVPERLHRPFDLVPMALIGLYLGAGGGGGSIGSGGMIKGTLVNVFLLPGPIFFFGHGLLLKVYAMSDLWSALLWPFLVSWLLLGLVLYWRGELTFPGPAIVLSWIMILAATKRYPGSYGSVRLRMMIMPFLLALIFETIRYCRQLPRARRRQCALLVGVQFGLILLAHLAGIALGIGT